MTTHPKWLDDLAATIPKGADHRVIAHAVVDSQSAPTNDWSQVATPQWNQWLPQVSGMASPNANAGISKTIHDLLLLDNPFTPLGLLVARSLGDQAQLSCVRGVALLKHPKASDPNNPHVMSAVLALKIDPLQQLSLAKAMIAHNRMDWLEEWAAFQVSVGVRRTNYGPPDLAKTCLKECIADLDLTAPTAPATWSALVSPLMDISRGPEEAVTALLDNAKHNKVAVGGMVTSWLLDNQTVSDGLVEHVLNEFVGRRLPDVWDLVSALPNAAKLTARMAQLAYANNSLDTIIASSTPEQKQLLARAIVGSVVSTSHPHLLGLAQVLDATPDTDVLGMLLDALSIRHPQVTARLSAQLMETSVSRSTRPTKSVKM